MKRFGVVVMMCLMATGGMAEQAPPPETSAAPPERPDPEDRLDALEKDETETDAPAPEAKDQPAPEADDAALKACLAQLDAMGAVYQTLPPRRDPDDADCGIDNPVAIQQIVEGVDVSPVAEMRCETAAALADWVVGIVQPAAQKLPDRGVLTGLDQGSSYVCRRRNNAPSGKLSEHSFGNGIDITAFRFATGDPIRIEPREREGTMAEAFQRTARAGSCLYFTTVLGPGTDAAHADHLHLDVKTRRGGFRLCQ